MGGGGTLLYTDNANPLFKAPVIFPIKASGGRFCHVRKRQRTSPLQQESSQSVWEEEESGCLSQKSLQHAYDTPVSVFVWRCVCMSLVSPHFTIFFLTPLLHLNYSPYFSFFFFFKSSFKRYAFKCSFSRQKIYKSDLSFFPF